MHAADATDAFMPLQGVRVLDLTKILAGPLCTQYLADMGADVVKVEPVKGGDDTRWWPPFEDGIGTIFLAVNRNKRSLALDLKSAEGLAICRRLAQQADVVMETFGPGVAQRLGLGYEDLREANPRLVYCSVSGYGTRGPMKDGKGYDLIAQAFAGMLSITGEPDGPAVRSPFSPVDQGTGMNAVIGILGALMQRGRTGKGMKIETSLFDSALGFLGYMMQGFWRRGTQPQRPGSGHESLCPYQAFDTRDRPLILGVANDAIWRVFCKVADADDLAADPRFTTLADRVSNRAETVAAVARVMMQRTRDEWIRLFEANGVPCSPVHDFEEVDRHPQTAASDMVVPYRNDQGRTLKTMCMPIRIDGERPALRWPPPRLGQHTREILRELNYGEADVQSLIDRNVVAASQP